MHVEHLTFTYDEVCVTSKAGVVKISGVKIETPPCLPFVASGGYASTKAGDGAPQIYCSHSPCIDASLKCFWLHSHQLIKVSLIL